MRCLAVITRSIVPHIHWSTCSLGLAPYGGRGGGQHVFLTGEQEDLLTSMRRRIHVSQEEEDTCVTRGGGYMCHKRRRIHVSREEEDTCVMKGEREREREVY